MIKNIILVGVGGQGILLAARIIASAAGHAGYDVTTNEIHGMAQRGGSVTAQIRYGEVVHSPLILEGTADVLGALEQVEALRYAAWLKPGALAAVSAESIIPVTVSSGRASYPGDVETRLPGMLFQSQISRLRRDRGAKIRQSEGGQHDSARRAGERA